MANKINQISNMPIVKEAFADWTVSIQLVKITEQNIGGFLKRLSQTINFKGAIQPLSVEQVQLKPEGQRSFEWLQVHVFTGNATNLNINDRIEYQGNPFKVMSKKDYSLNGYIEYHIMGDYK